MITVKKQNTIVVMKSILRFFLKNDFSYETFSYCQNKEGFDRFLCKLSVLIKSFSKRTIVFFLLFIFGLFVFVDFKIVDNYYGLFVLKKENGIGIEIVNDLYPDQAKRLIFKLDFNPFYENVIVKNLKSDEYPFLNYVWDKKNGRGFVKNFLNEKEKILYVFSRYKEEKGNMPKGLFLGGELPIASYNEDKDFLNDTGMAYYDGVRWYHIWCTTNQGFSSVLDTNTLYPPSEWKFLGSEKVENGDDKLILKSSHIAYVDGAPFAVDRIAYFKAGEPYFILEMKIKNIGDNIAGFFYVYGDEPWLGDYGYSEGDVGWTKDGLILTEKQIDPKKYNFVGLYDYGNELIGETHNFTNMANFIEWEPKNPPTTVYFANQFGSVDERKPLAHQLNRVVSLQWGPIYLKPNEIYNLKFAVGMAIGNPSLKLPMKPIVDFSLAKIK